VLKRVQRGFAVVDQQRQHAGVEARRGVPAEARTAEVRGSLDAIAAPPLFPRDLRARVAVEPAARLAPFDLRARIGRGRGGTRRGGSSAERREGEGAQNGQRVKVHRLLPWIYKSTFTEETSTGAVGS
jgi:hypothetical protein